VFASGFDSSLSTGESTGADFDSCFANSFWNEYTYGKLTVSHAKAKNITVEATICFSLYERLLFIQATKIVYDGEKENC
jgi:hypothetical protein